MKNKELYENILEHTVNNEIEILNSDNCSCIFCCQTYSARLVKDWVPDADGNNAICPNCGIDAVIGDSSGYIFDKKRLKTINLHFFGKRYMSNNPLCLQTYIDRYNDEEITHNQKNEELFKKYCGILSIQGNANATYELGLLYDTGSEFTESDPLRAFRYYTHPELLCDPFALNRLGMLYKSGRLGSKNSKKAYECFSKASALASLEGAVHFFDCYIDGTFVKRDPHFAFVGLNNLLDESYRRFLSSSGKDISFLPQISLRIAKMHMDSNGVEQNDILALRLLLLAEYGFYLLQGDKDFLRHEDAEDYDETLQRIKILSSKYGFIKSDPIFDDNTFFDSFTGTKAIDFKILKKCKFISDNFDADKGVFQFTLKASSPFLVIDHESLFCSFVDSPISWTFSTVADVVGESDYFDFVAGDLEYGWMFTKGNSSNLSPVISIIYYPSDSEDFDGLQEGSNLGNLS